MHRHMLSVALVMLYMAGFTAAEAAQVPEIKVLQDHGSHITIEFHLQGYTIEPVEVNGTTCSRIVLPGEVTFLDKGMPELPRVSRSVIIPDDAVMDYRIVDIEYETERVNTILPSKGNLYRNVNPDDVPYTFDRFYQMDAWWPEHTVETAEPFILRDYRGLSISINPFQYNPVRNELKVVKKVIIEVYEVNKGGANVIREKKSGITREFVDIYESIFLNFTQARYDSIAERAGRMVIICTDGYMSNMDPFKIWKRMKGIETKMVTISSIGNTENNIKNFIQAEYNAGGLVWVLLVGDGNEVVPATGTIGGASGYDADPVYAYTAGSDYYPDLFISRFSSRGSAVNIDKQVNRSIEYEKTPQASADWYHVGLGVASNLTGGGEPYADSTRCNWLRDSLLAYTYTEVNKSYDPTGSSALIKSYIESGTGIINYIGHGSENGWGNGGGFTISDINSLNNPWMLPFVISVACVVGNFDGIDCYCEVSVTAGEVGQPDGFIAHWGSSINQSWVPPCYGQEGAVNLLTHDKNNTFGGICFNGACYMIDHYGATDPEGIDMAQTWHIFGDASIQLRTDTPVAMTVNHAASISIGQSAFNVSVPGVQDALVGLYIDTLLVGHGYTDGAGNVTISLNPVPAQPGTMYITVTAYNKIPYLGSVPIIAPSGPYVTMGLFITNDSGGDGQVNPGETIDLGVWAKNVGVAYAYGVYGLLSESDPYVSVNIDSSWYGNIAADDSSLSSPYYEFTIANNCPDNHTVNFSLEFHDNNDSVWTSYPSVTVYAPVLTYQTVSVNGGNGNGILDPGETADLVVTIENEGGAAAANVTSTLMTASPGITINDDSGNFGTIDPGNTADNAADPYTVSASGTIPTGTTINFQIEVVAGIYVDTLDFNLVVGKKHYYVWNPDGTPAPGENMHSILTSLGYVGDYGTTLAPDLSLFQAVLVCVGVFPNNYVINTGSPEAAALVDFLQNQGGRMYLEGNDVWYYDPPTGYDFGPLFGINAVADGFDDMGPVVGETGTFTNSMNFSYAGENMFMDHIDPTGTGFLIFHDGDDAYNCGVANDPGTYKTVGTSFELGLLTDGTAPSTRAALIDSIMSFFGIIPPVVEESYGLTGMPVKTQMSALCPNPFSGRLTIRYQIAAKDQRADISLKIYDVTGRLVRTLPVDQSTNPPVNHIIWHGDDDAGRAVSAGIYFVRFKVDDYTKIEKAILLR